MYAAKRHPHPFARARLQMPFGSFIVTGVVRVSVLRSATPTSLDWQG